MIRCIYTDKNKFNVNFILIATLERLVLLESMNNSIVTIIIISIIVIVKE